MQLPLLELPYPDFPFRRGRRQVLAHHELLFTPQRDAQKGSLGDAAVHF